MPDDLEFQEEKKFKAPVLNGIYLKRIKIRYLKVSLKAGFIVRSHHHGQHTFLNFTFATFAVLKIPTARKTLNKF